MSSSNDERLEQLKHWLRHELHWPLMQIAPASADASFRRYFRIWRADGSTQIVMDAPPDKEAVGPYLKVSALLERCEVHVPRIEASDATRGFVLLEDLGSSCYLSQLQAGADADALYHDALETLLRIQLNGRQAAHELPPYDQAVLATEMALMPEWFCGRHLGLGLEQRERSLIAASFEFLIDEALAQPVVFVHRDFHSRNLMLLEHRNPGVIDFQDALAGPCAYDLVSLLKDCYIGWPRARVEGWVSGFRARLMAGGGDGGRDEVTFLRWFDLIGLQRHIKVLGIFARLWYRDGKSGYLGDLPRTLDYVRDSARRYPELREFSHWVEERLVRPLAAANTRALAGAHR
jgi:N-acetylmuramate 1-kinase